MHRGNLVNLLLIGGDEIDRLEVATRFHHESRLGRGPLISARAPEDSPRLGRAILRALHRGIPRPDDVLHASEGGTLFLDRLDLLGRDEQRLLLEFLTRGRADYSPEYGWAGRLAAGSACDLETLCAEGRFLPALLDALDKIRIDLRIVC